MNKQRSPVCTGPLVDVTIGAADAASTVPRTRWAGPGHCTLVRAWPSAMRVSRRAGEGDRERGRAAAIAIAQTQGTLSVERSGADSFGAPDPLRHACDPDASGIVDRTRRCTRYSDEDAGVARAIARKSERRPPKRQPSPIANRA